MRPRLCLCVAQNDSLGEHFSTLGGITVPASYAAQTPYVGEFQINFTVPQQFATMAAGNYPLTISYNGVSSPANVNTSPPGAVVIPVEP